MARVEKTKFSGPVRVRHEPPTLDEAIIAATGLSDDPQQQAEIAAELMGLPVAEVRAKIPSPTRHGRTAPVHGGRTVIVERRTPVRQFRIPVR